MFGGPTTCVLLLAVAAGPVTPPSWSPEQDRVLRTVRDNAFAASPSWTRRVSAPRCGPG